jgi:hypothetical protein
MIREADSWGGNPLNLPNPLTVFLTFERGDDLCSK